MLAGAACAISLHVEAPVLDVLLAVWILEPDSRLVSEFNAEGRSGKKASSKVRWAQVCELVCVFVGVLMMSCT